jgi:ribosome maturation factor RimP
LTDIARLTQLIEPEAEALGFALVRVKMFGGKSDPTLQVMAERPDTRQLTIDDCSALSRRISDVLDEHDPIEDAYRLEVSSPGIDRPLTRLQDYADWTGHEARVQLVEPVDGRKKIMGDINGLDGDAVLLALPDGKTMRVPFANIGDAKLSMTDRLIAATQPLDQEGADEIEEEDQD